MLHQTDNGICGWFRYAGYLTSRGFHVLLFDRRCTGLSSCPSGDAAFRHVDDVQTSVDELRRRGATTIMVVGASLGGAVAIGACAAVKVSGCVALSPAVLDLKLGHGLTAGRAIGKVGVPLLVAVAPDDPDSPLADVRTLVARAQPTIVDFVRLPPGSGHGWDTVDDPADPTRHSEFSDTPTSFLRK
jgi:dienelactone hydrolase